MAVTATDNGLYTFGELEQLWVQAGGDPTYAAVAAGVALAESGGNPQAVDYDADGSVDRGLWQINSVHGSLSTFDVMGNARAAVSISNNGTNWGPWVSDPIGALAASGPTPSLATIESTLTQDKRASAAQLADAQPGGSSATFTSGGTSSNSANSGGTSLGGAIVDVLDPLAGLLGTANPVADIAGAVSKGVTDWFVTFIDDELFGGLSPGEILVRGLELAGGALLIGVGLVMVVYVIAKNPGAQAVPDTAEGKLPTATGSQPPQSNARPQRSEPVPGGRGVADRPPRRRTEAVKELQRRGRATHAARPGTKRTAREVRGTSRRAQHARRAPAV